MFGIVKIKIRKIMGIFENLFRNTYTALQKGIAQAIAEENSALNEIKKDIIFKLKEGTEVYEIEYGLRSNLSKKKKIVDIKDVSSKQMYQVLRDIVPNVKYDEYTDNVEGMFDGYLISLSRIRTADGIHVFIYAYFLDIHEFVTEIKKKHIKNDPSKQKLTARQKIPTNILVETDFETAFDEKIEKKVAPPSRKFDRYVKKDSNASGSNDEIVITSKTEEISSSEPEEYDDTIIDQIGANTQNMNEDYELDITEFHKFNQRKSLKKLKFNNGCVTIDKK